jgi:hypothetical protein
VPLLTVHLLLTLSNSFVGTLVNTSLMDLGQQLKFIGIEKTWSLLRKLNSSTFRRIGNHQANYGNGGRPQGRAPEMPGHHDAALTKANVPRHVNYFDVSSAKGKVLLLLLLLQYVDYYYFETYDKHSLCSSFYSFSFVHRHTVPSLSTFLQPTETNTILLRRLHAPTTRP